MKSHVVCLPIPVQSHIGGMLKLARLLHHRGCFVTFINTEFNHRRLLRSGGLASLEDLPGWRFFAIPNGIPPSDADATQDISALCDSIRDYIVNPLCDLLGKLTEEDGSKNGSEVPRDISYRGGWIHEFCHSLGCREIWASTGTSVHNTMLCGWNSVLESLSAGVPMICCPNFGDQQMNARYVCAEWKAGLEAGGGNVKRDEVEKVVRELLGGEKGKEVKRNAAEWRRLAEEATTGPAGSAVRNLDKLVEDVLSTRRGT